MIGGRDAPGHLALMNMLARSAGHRNYQTLRAKPLRIDATPVANDVAINPIVLPRGSGLPRACQRALGQFDTAGRLIRWPSNYSVQQLALFGLWIRLPAKRDLTEAEVNGYLNQFHHFGDAATLRRELVNARLLWRTKDGRIYRKLVNSTTVEASQFIKALIGFTAGGPP